MSVGSSTCCFYQKVQERLLRFDEMLDDGKDYDGQLPVLHGCIKIPVYDFEMKTH